MTAPDNPIVAEVRANREKICADYGHDLDRIIEALRAIEREHPERVVRVRKHVTFTVEPADLSEE